MMPLYRRTAAAAISTLARRLDGLRVVRPAVDRERLPGHKIAVGRGEEDQRAQKILRVFVALDGAANERRCARVIEVAGVFVDDAVGQRKAGRQVVDADVVLA